VTFSRKSTFVFFLICILFIGACSKDSRQTIRARRSTQKETTTSKSVATLPTIPTTTHAVTTPVDEHPFLTLAQLKSTWKQAKLCAILTPTNAQKVFDINTAPSQQYSATDDGVTCLYRSGTGDELYIRIASTSYADSRSVDAAVGMTTTPVTVAGVGGVKSSDGSDTIIELNFWGDASNEWMIGGPSDKKTTSAAEIIVKNANTK
jgi:hypothetical protein